VSLPEQERRALDVALLETSEVLTRVPHPHVGLAEAHVVPGVATEMLVGEEQHLVAAGECPLQHGPSVRRRAHGPTVLTDEGFQCRRGVHVGDGNDPPRVGDFGQPVPTLLDLVDVGHVGHRATGIEIGEDDALVRAGEHIGRLGHEVHTAEHDVGGVGVVRREACELERVTPGIGPLDDLVTLVVVSEDQQPRAELGLRSPDPLVELVGGRAGVAVSQWRLQSQHRLSSPKGRAPMWPAGTAWSPTAGLSASEPILWPEYQARLARSITRRRGPGIPDRHR
jgi:hypothetical protein